MEKAVKNAKNEERNKAYGFEDRANRIGISHFYSRILNRDIAVLSSDNKKGEPVTIFGEAVSFGMPLPKAKLEENEWQLKVTHSKDYVYYCVYIKLPELVESEAKKILTDKAKRQDLGSR
ncbi:MAG: hypothetical protein N3F07_01430 [Candidatus Micrarchaeota archaeon]|nr:hypothetical protein [Candidatus Micrarchaeota archaeon]